MQLSAEDNLRLNVLLTQNLYAVRIDESKMTVYALTEKGEAKVLLNPTDKDEKYIREIKVLLSTHAMDSPGGYPVHLKEWTRMGQARDENLSQFLLLGEPEAVVAVVHAAGLTHELAQRAWWAMPNSENARKMLENQAVAEGALGKELAEFLIEFLPFEEQQNDMIESVRLVLQSGLISQEDKEKLWARTKSKRSFYVGFLHAAADELPFTVNAHSRHESIKQKLNPYLENKDPHAIMLEKALSAKGQAFIKTVEDALKKPGTQDVVVSLFAAISNYFSSIVPKDFNAEDINEICNTSAELCCSTNPQVQTLITSINKEDSDACNVQDYLSAMTVLACLNVKLLNHIFSRSDAIGTVMRKKIKPITDPVFEQLAILRD